MNQASLAGFTEIVQLSDRRYGRTNRGNLVYLDSTPAPQPVEPDTKFPVEVGIAGTHAQIDSAVGTLQPSEVKSETESIDSVGIIASGSNTDVLAAIGQEL